MSKWALYIVLLFPITNIAAQNKNLPEEAMPFLLPGYETLDYITGDLNADNKADAILVLKQNGEDSSFDEINRVLIILTRQANGKLKAAVRNDSAILCFRCGGVFGDPYESITVAKNGFEISFYGGSAWRWGMKYSFTYIAAKNNWYLTHQNETSYHNTDIENTEKELDLDKSELDEVAIGNFNVNKGFVQTEWKVTAAKTFFYSHPKLGSKPRKGYLIKGDKVSSFRVLKNFVQGYFENSKQQNSSGFILKKHLLQTK